MRSRRVYDALKSVLRMFDSVRAIAVSRLNDDVVTGRRRFRIANDRLVILAEVAREKHATLLTSVRDFDEHLTGTKYVTGDSELSVDIFRDTNRRPVVRHYLKQLQSLARVLFGVKRERRRVLRDLVPIAIVGFFFLQTRRVRQKNSREIGSPARAIHWSAKTMTHQTRQVTGVLDMRVRQQHRVKRSSIERRLLPITLSQLTPALKQPGINQHARAIRFDQVFRAGNCPGRAPKCK